MSQASQASDDLSRKDQEVDGEHEVPMSELFGPGFMQRNTDFVSMDDMIEASGHDVQSQADFEAIPDDEQDALVKAKTRFLSRKDMMSTAGSEWAMRKMDL